MLMISMEPIKYTGDNPIAYFIGSIEVGNLKMRHVAREVIIQMFFGGKGRTQWVFITFLVNFFLNEKSFFFKGLNHLRVQWGSEDH